MSLGRTCTRESHCLYYFQTCPGKENFKTKIDTSSSFILQLHAMFVFHKSDTRLGILILICLNLIISINPTVPPKGVCDFLPFLCLHWSIIFPLSMSPLCLSLRPFSLGGYFFFSGMGDYCIESFFRK